MSFRPDDRRFEIGYTGYAKIQGFIQEVKVVGWNFESGEYYSVDDAQGMWGDVVHGDAIKHSKNQSIMYYISILQKEIDSLRVQL